jgi:hypothetical protein
VLALATVSVANGLAKGDGAAASVAAGVSVCWPAAVSWTVSEGGAPEVVVGWLVALCCDGGAGAAVVVQAEAAASRARPIRNAGRGRNAKRERRI